MIEEEKSPSEFPSTENQLDGETIYRSCDETLHVFDDHTGHSIKTVDLDCEDLGLGELVSIIHESREELRSFRVDWLIPILKELNRRRTGESAEDLASIKLSLLLLHLSAIGRASDSLIKSARPAGASGHQTLVLSNNLMKLAQAVGAAGRAFAQELGKK